MKMAKNIVTSSEVIQDKEFNGGAVLLAEDWEPLIVKNFENLGPRFFESWRETPSVVLTGELSADCSKIERLNLVTVGKVFTTRPAEFAAIRFWPLQDKDVLLKINTLNLESFKFNSKMYSDFLDHGEIPYNMIDPKGQLYPLVDLVKQDWDGFCLRAVVAPDSTYSAKLHIYIYPHIKETMHKEYGLADRIEFPAVLLTSGTAELGPQQAGIILDKNVGCPIIPAVKTEAKMKDTGKWPSAGEVSWKVAALFGSVETRTTVKTLFDRMEVVKRDGEKALKGAPAPRIWPESVRPVETAGKFIVK